MDLVIYLWMIHLDGPPSCFNEDFDMLGDWQLCFKRADLKQIHPQEGQKKTRKQKKEQLEIPARRLKTNGFGSGYDAQKAI